MSLSFFTAETLGSLATVNTLLLNISPMTDEIPAIKRAKATGDRNPLLFVCIWANALLWIEYGFFVEQVHPIVTTNLLGLVAGAYYLMIFYRFATPANKSLVINYFAVAFFVVVFMYLYAFVFEASSLVVKRSRLGALCSAVTVAMYASPLAALKKAIQTRSNRGISLSFALLGTSNSLFWSGYGFLRNDPWVLTPNLLGAGCSIMQLGSYYYLSDTVQSNLDHDYEKLPRSGSGGIAMKPLRSPSPALA